MDIVGCPRVALTALGSSTYFHQRYAQCGPIHLFAALIAQFKSRPDCTLPHAFVYRCGAFSEFQSRQLHETPEINHSSGKHIRLGTVQSRKASLFVGHSATSITYRITNRIHITQCVPIANPKTAETPRKCEREKRTKKKRKAHDTN